MPTRVRLSCPKCGIVETYNYLYPDDQASEQYCPICGYEYATVIEGTLVPIEGETKVVDPVYREETENKEEKYVKKERKRKRD